MLTFRNCVNIFKYCQAKTTISEVRSHGDVETVESSVSRPYRIEQLHQIRALASPVRQDLVDAVVSEGPCTIAELAERVGRPADALYHHVRRLVAAGLLVEESVRRAAGRPAVRLTVPGRPMMIAYDQQARGHVAASSDVVATMLRSARRGFARALAAPGVRTWGPRRNLWGARTHGWLTARDVETANALLSKLLAVFLRGKGTRRHGSARHEFTFVLAPARVVTRGAARRPKRRKP
jgi:predicted transcriptional regulator